MNIIGKTTDDYWNVSSNVENFFSEDEEEGLNFFEEADTNILYSLKEKDNIPIHLLISSDSLKLVTNCQQQSAGSSIADKVTNIYLDSQHDLHNYKELKQKIELLDKSIETCDGNAILTVTLFIEKTLNFNLFLQSITKHKLALDQYYVHLMRQNNVDKLSSIHMATNCSIGMIDMLYLNKQHDKKQMLTKLERFTMEQAANSRFEKDLLANYKNFISWQIKKQISCDSVIEQLAVNFKENLQKSGSSSSNDDLKSLMKISDLQYEWVKLNVLASFKMWNKLSELFIKSNWFTKKNEIKSAISEELFLSALHKHGAPKIILEDFLNSIPPEELTLYLGKKLQCHKYVVNYFINQKDRIGLLGYKSNLLAGSEEFILAENALLSDKKWKN